MYVTQTLALSVSRASHSHCLDHDEVGANEQGERWLLLQWHNQHSSPVLAFEPSRLLVTTNASRCDPVPGAHSDILQQ